MCICTQIGLPFNGMVLLGLFTDSVDQIMSETHELKGSTVVVDFKGVLLNVLLNWESNSLLRWW